MNKNEMKTTSANQGMGRMVKSSTVQKLQRGMGRKEGESRETRERAWRSVARGMVSSGESDPLHRRVGRQPEVSQEDRARPRKED